MSDTAKSETANIPPIARVREKLGGLTKAQLEKISDASGVPTSTLMKIRHGVTQNPGIETVRAFYEFLPWGRP